MTGLDVSIAAARSVKERLGLDVLAGDLLEVKLPPEAFDLVTLWDVFEHVPEPLRALSVVHRALVPGGHAVVKVPNTLSPSLRADFLLGRLQRRNRYHTPTHLYHYTAATIARAVSTTLSVRAVRRIDEWRRNHAVSSSRMAWLFWQAIYGWERLTGERESLLVVARRDG